jgi:pimeloyl-ACP methyl ester carboxylesterase
VRAWQWAKATCTDELVANILVHFAFRHRNNPRAIGPRESDAPHLFSGDHARFFGGSPEIIRLPDPGPVRYRTPLWTVHDSSFPSAEPSGWPESDVVWLRRFVPTQTATRPRRTLVGVHGIVQRGTGWFNWIAERVAPQGIEIVTVDSPFNYRRAPKGYFPGQLILGGDLGHQLNVTRQAVRDTWQVVRSLQAEGREVGLIGVSYGGFIALLTSLLAEQLALVVAVTPPVNTLKLLQEGGTLIRAVRMGLGKEPLDLDRLETIVRPLVPHHHRPKLAGERVHLHIAEFDRFVKAEHIRELSRRWNAPASEYPEGHYSVTMQPTIIEPLVNNLLATWNA